MRLVAPLNETTTEKRKLNRGNSNRRVNQSKPEFLLTRPGFIEGVGAQRQPWDQNINSDRTLKGFATRLTLSGFGPDFKMLSQGSRDARTAGLKLANASGV